MKVNIEIDCTPDEARRFLGLPDVVPMQEAVMAQIQKQMQDAIASASPEALMRTWLPFAPLTPEQLQKTMAGFVSAALSPKMSGNEKG
jgi:hypothetical protein